MLLVISAKKKIRAALTTCILSLLTFLILSVVLPEELQNRYLTLIDSSKGPANAQTSAEGRLDGFMWGIYVWQRSPLLGFGPVSFAFSTGREGQAHNLYGQVMAELGLAGAIALLWIIWCHALNHLDNRRYALHGRIDLNNFTYQLSQAMILNIVLLLIMGWAGHNLFRYNWQWYAAFSVCSTYCLRQRLLASSCSYQSSPSLQFA